MTDTTNRIAGIVYLTVDGISYAIAAEAEYQMSRIERTEIFGIGGVCDYSEQPIAGSISATLRDVYGLSVTNISQMTKVTVVLELANGKTVIGKKMWTASVGPVKTQEATLEVVWKGYDVEVDTSF